ncbi:MAG: hypothetical protein GY703_01170 [Gammaproteobacteria bacterium]|nr:hypothetical protein [Gammaproteobacteria bacterium]
MSARIPLIDLWEKAGIELPQGSYSTLGGFLLEKANTIPKTGTVIEYQGTNFQILKVTARAILEVRIYW